VPAQYVVPLFQTTAEATVAMLNVTTGGGNDAISDRRALDFLFIS